MSPTSSSRLLAGRKTRSAAPRTKTLLLLTPCCGVGREGYATPICPLKREPCALLAKSRKEQHIDALSALQIAGHHHPFGAEPKRLGEGPGGLVVRCRG